MRTSHPLPSGASSPKFWRVRPSWFSPKFWRVMSSCALPPLRFKRLRLGSGSPGLNNPPCAKAPADHNIPAKPSESTTAFKVFLFFIFSIINELCVQKFSQNYGKPRIGKVAIPINPGYNSHVFRLHFPKFGNIFHKTGYIYQNPVSNHWKSPIFVA